MKISHPLRGWGSRVFDTAHFFYCPGCEENHMVYVTNRDPANTGSPSCDPVDDVYKPTWRFYGGLDCPTLYPSVLIDRPGQYCHLVVKDGRITYLDDCDHHLAGVTIDMVDLD